jgi:hypothetical protein
VGLAAVAGLATTLFFKVEPPASVSGSAPAVSLAPAPAAQPPAAPAPVVAPRAPELTELILATTDAPQVDARLPGTRPSASRARGSRRVNATPAVHTRSTPAPAPQLAADEDATLPMSDTVGAF